MLRLFINKLKEKRNPIKYWRSKGVKIGENCALMGGCSFGGEPYLVDVGNHVLIGGNVHFITHEGAHWVLKGLDKKYDYLFGFGRIQIKDNVYIGYNSTILRGVEIGENVIIGACSLVNKSCEPNAVYAGIPAKRICSLDEWKTKFLADMPDYDAHNYRMNKKDEILRIVDKFHKR